MSIHISNALSAFQATYPSMGWSNEKTVIANLHSLAQNAFAGGSTNSSKKETLSKELLRNPKIKPCICSLAS